ncbi:Biopolymer transport protein exbD1 [Sterolibacterium denitrificans]|uniref:Biopolymer transport protein exbD1 n=1 Tax=Sterolibacterium denitrificans TaxID=157592 RepID=A0A7Z7MVR7_9PROT|nr:biopolymer transporter ExbD [Sterolibacterium denitrificans]SMB28691.1 Biopolymer transport protein exbD1 [Sterolibacterium denitrificans]
MGLGTLGGSSSGRPMAEINVVPLVDVMLVLLVVFIVTAPLLTHAVKLELPQARSQPNVTRSEHIEIAVQRDGTIFWNGTPLPREEVERRAAALALDAPDSEIHLKGDDAVPYGEMARLLSMLARQGLTRIGFVTDPRTE